MRIDKLSILSGISNDIWAMDEDKVKTFALSCIDASEKSADSLAKFYPMKSEMSIAALPIGKVAIIPIKGSLMNKAPGIYEELGLVTTYKTIQSQTQLAIEDGAVGIIYHVDSPGGTVSGCIETADMIAGLGVPTVAYCEWTACSAAYWLASQTDYIVTGKSANIGNIGAVLAWADLTKFWESMGVEFKALVSEGASLKSTFHTEPNEEQISFLQESINEAGKSFSDSVVVARRKAGIEMDDEVFKAGWYSGEKAISLGLADDIGTLEKALEYFVE